MVRSRSEYNTSMLVSGLPTFLISVKNMSLTSCLTQCQTEKKFSPTLRNIYKKQHGARPCVEKMQLIFFVPPNEES
jgi:hypothetical protein